VATPHHAFPPALPQVHPLHQVQTAPNRLARRRLRAAALVGACAALTLGLLPGTAAADPGEASTSEEAARLVAEASHPLEVVTEQFNEAREALEQQQAAADEAQQAKDAADDRLADLDGQIRELARSAYTGEQVDEFDLMLTSGSVDEFVSQLGTLNAIAGHTNDQVAEVASASEEAADAEAEAAQAADEARATLAEIEDRQADLEAEIAEYEEQFDALSAAEQQAVTTAHAGQAVTAAPAAAPGQAAQVAVDTALAQVGDPYVWAAAGPDAFDCSGLTQYAYAAAGVSLPHSSSMQSQMGTPVSRDQLQPGDLVFFYSPVSHVGMYIGNGQMVHASTSGTPVLVASLDSFPSYSGARRIV
jgi:cell wall-associated NlpC family hydrolase